MHLYEWADSNGLYVVLRREPGGKRWYARLESVDGPIRDVFGHGINAEIAQVVLAEQARGLTLFGPIVLGAKKFYSVPRNLFYAGHDIQ
jgi:hypothetical protein